MKITGYRLSCKIKNITVRKENNNSFSPLGMLAESLIRVLLLVSKSKRYCTLTEVFPHLVWHNKYIAPTSLLRPQMVSKNWSQKLSYTRLRCHWILLLRIVNNIVIDYRFFAFPIISYNCLAQKHTYAINTINCHRKRTPDHRARQLYKNISMLFLFPVKDGKLSTGVNATFNASCYG